MVDVGDAAWYFTAHDLFVNALTLTTEQARVPACPLWNAHDLLAHQVHQVWAAADGTFPVSDAMAAITAPNEVERARSLQRQEVWIAAGVNALRQSPRDDLIDRWTEVAAHARPQALTALVPDIVVHLFDLLGVTADNRFRDHPLVERALQFWAPIAVERVREATGAAISIEPVDRVGLGADDGHATVAGPPFELLRTITGRRSLNQAKALSWGGASSSVVEAFPVYGWRHDPLDE